MHNHHTPTIPMAAHSRQSRNRPSSLVFSFALSLSAPLRLSQVAPPGVNPPERGQPLRRILSDPVLIPFRISLRAIQLRFRTSLHRSSSVVLSSPLLFSSFGSTAAVRVR